VDVRVLMTKFDRHYSLPRATRVAIAVSYVVLLFALVLVVVERASAVFVALCGVAAAFSIWGGRVVLSRGGLYEMTDGIANRQLVWWREARWAWADIECFRSVGTSVYVVLRDGTVSALIGVAQGHRSRWDGGETRDITAVLNERLDLWRSEHGATDAGRQSSTGAMPRADPVGGDA
jgi:hypothetical protein